MTPRKQFLKPLAALAALSLCLILPAAAAANIAFVRGFANSTVYTANDNGRNVQKVGKGSSPHISPDGATVVYYAEASGNKPLMKIANVGGGPGKTLLTNWQEPFNLVFSPNSEQILATRGGALGQRTLVLITIASGEVKELDRGYFNGFSFDPEGKEIVYGKARSETFPQRSDIYRISAAGGKPTRLTTDHVSLTPLWGPTGKIVFVKQIGAKQRKYGPKNELYLMNENGKGVKRLTHTKVGPLLLGLVPTAWSANGNRLLAQFQGQDTSYAVGVNVRNGSQRPILEATEQGLFGAALSPDGKTVYGATGGFEPGGQKAVVAVPWSGGKPKVLVKNAHTPSFSY